MFTAVLLRRVDRFEIGAQGISHVTTEMDHTEVTGDLGEGGSVAAGGEKPDWILGWSLRYTVMVDRCFF